MRYVLLHHVGHGRSHFDLMLDVGGGEMLESYRLPDWPPGDDLAEPAPPHRRDYLDFRGDRPVSGNRGHVRFIEVGHYVRGGGTLTLRPDDSRLPPRRVTLPDAAAPNPPPPPASRGT